MYFRTQRRRRPFKDANAIQEPAFDKATWSVVGQNSQSHQHSTTRSHQLEYLQSRIPKSTVSDQGPGARWHSSTMPNCILCMRCLHIPSCSVSYLSAHEYLNRCSAHFTWDAAAINLAFRPGSRGSAPPASSSSALYAQYSPYMHQHHVWNASTKMWLRSQLHHLLLLRLAQVDLPPALSVKLQTAALAPKGASFKGKGKGSSSLLGDLWQFILPIRSRRHRLPSQPSVEAQRVVRVVMGRQRRHSRASRTIPGRRSTGSND